jgi:hypothetical protein
MGASPVVILHIREEYLGPQSNLLLAADCGQACMSALLSEAK